MADTGHRQRLADPQYANFSTRHSSHVLNSSMHNSTNGTMPGMRDQASRMGTATAGCVAVRLHGR